MNQKILLVEDEAIIALAEKRQLEGYGYEVSIVHNGLAAIKTVLTDPDIDLVLMDIDLGRGIDGTVAAERILTQRNIPILFLSSHTEQAVVEKTERISSYGYVVKNSGIVVLDASIKMALKLFKAKLDQKRVEQALEKRMISLTRPLGHPQGLGFEDLFNIDDIQKLQDLFAEAFGVASIITDATGNPITEQSRFTRLCRDIIRQTEIGRKNCFKSDAYLGRFNPDGPTIQPCLSCGLWDAGAAISVEGEHIASWLIGQVRNELQSEESMRRYARKIGAEERPFIEAFYDIPSMSRERFETIARTLFTLANMLSDSAYQNVQQARVISELQAAEKNIQKQLLDKDLILKELNHRMKNNILGIEGFLALQADSHSNPEVHEALQSAISRIKSMRVLYERLLSHEDAQEVSIRNYIENLIESILEVFPLPKPITIQQELGDFYLHAKKATNLGIILNELITNTFKHAFPAIEKGVIRIILKKSGSTASLVVEDNGVGIDEGSLDTKAPSFGLTIVKMLADQLSGKLEIMSNSGTRVRLEFEV